MLDLFFRKYAWTANLLLLFAAAWLLARTVNTLVGAAIRPRPEVDAAATSAPPPRPVLPTALDNDKLYRLIGVEPPKVAETGPVNAPPPRPQTCNDEAARPIKTDLRLQLVAGVVAEKAGASLATILDPQTREARVLGVGEEFNGARLLGVQRVKDDADLTGNAFRVVAVICNGGTKEYVDDSPGTGTVAEAPNLGVAPVAPGRPAARPAPAAGGVPTEGIRKVAENRYELDKQVIESALSNLNTLATQARLVPSFKNGQANGFKLFQIQPGSLYSSIGIENGDVITRINGYEVNSPDKALEVYQKLRESSHVTIELERGGQPIKKDYTISGP
jgi:general secretion pathway protein C